VIFKVYADKCVGCAVCVDACPEGAISMTGGKAVIDESLCVQCGKCTPICPQEAIFSDASGSIQNNPGVSRGSGKGMGRGLRRGVNDGTGKCGGGRGRRRI